MAGIWRTSSRQGRTEEQHIVVHEREAGQRDSAFLPTAELADAPQRRVTQQAQSAKRLATLLNRDVRVILASGIQHILKRRFVKRQLLCQVLNKIANFGAFTQMMLASQQRFSACNGTQHCASGNGTRMSM